MKRSIVAVFATLAVGACASSGSTSMNPAPVNAKRVVDGTAKARLDSTLRAFVGGADLPDDIAERILSGNAAALLETRVRA